ncbi:LGFP repeat-containing protein [Mycobacterium sp. DL592]|uniref:LGFP repeat-containing protein n=1 Tax=Mycobacterium sp. DL592 TaxID=2675524 RepID=UPI00141F11F2|nr:hypothetical protein [Mycobacterium sp. DL592]
MTKSRARRGNRLATVGTAVFIAAAIGTGIVLWPGTTSRHDAVAEAAVINPAPTTIGFSQPGEFMSMTAADIGHTLDLMVATGAKTLRTVIPWSVVEQTKGTLNWSLVDAVVNAAVARSMSILGIVAFTPDWARAAGTATMIGRPASVTDFAAFAKKAAARYNGKISAYEIWNEPNSSLFYSPGPDPTGYTALLKAAYPAIKSVSSSLQVVAGALGADVTSATATDPVTFLTQMYAAGAKNYFDALSFHPYQYSLSFSAGVDIANSPVQQLMDMRTTMVTNGDSAKKIWATEYGEPTAAVDENTQSSMINDVVTKWQELPYTGPVMIYTTRDKSTGSSDPEDTFGVFRSDWAPKIAQQVLQWQIANGIPKSPEYQRFSAVTDASYGAVLSPVYKATSTVWAQVRANATVFETAAAGYVSSPNPVALKARPLGVAPTGAFANGYQDFETGVRIFYSAATGAHVVGSGIASAWTSALGLATTDEVPMSGGGVRVDFQHGFITWTPSAGAVATRS